MIIFPAIDLKEGRCVRLLQGKMDQATVYGDDPAAMALQWQEQGAQWLHVVDLDGAIAGWPQNLEVLKAISGVIDIPIQFGGGIRSPEMIEQVLSAGATRIVIGTSFFSDPKFARRSIDSFADQVAVGLDAKDSMIAVRGWVEVTDMKLIEAAEKAIEFGVQRLICTDISTDGAMTGPNLTIFRELTDLFSVAIIASGGVAKLSDIDDLRRVSGDRIEGVIIGRALYEGAFSLPEAIKAGGNHAD